MSQRRYHTLYFSLMAYLRHKSLKAPLYGVELNTLWTSKILSMPSWVKMLSLCVVNLNQGSTWLKHLLKKLLRRPPYMTFKQKEKGWRNIPNLRTISVDFADKEGGGVKNSQYFVEVIYGSTLTPCSLTHIDACPLCPSTFPSAMRSLSGSQTPPESRVDSHQTLIWIKNNIIAAHFSSILLFHFQTWDL